MDSNTGHKEPRYEVIYRIRDWETGDIERLAEEAYTLKEAQAIRRELEQDPDVDQVRIEELY